MNSKIRIYTKYLIIDKQIRSDYIKNIKNSKNLWWWKRLFLECLVIP